MQKHFNNIEPWNVLTALSQPGDLQKITFNDKKPVNTAAFKLLQLERAPLKAKFRS